MGADVIAVVGLWMAVPHVKSDNGGNGGKNDDVTISMVVNNLSSTRNGQW